MEGFGYLPGALKPQNPKPFFTSAAGVVVYRFVLAFVNLRPVRPLMALTSAIHCCPFHPHVVRSRTERPCQREREPFTVPTAQRLGETAVQQVDLPQRLGCSD